MVHRYSFVWRSLLPAFLFVAHASLGQQPNLSASDLNARDVFWSAADLAGKRPQTGVHKTPAHVPASTTQVKNTQPSGSSSPAVKQVSVSSAPLGLRFSILKERTDGSYDEVGPDSTFHAGDRIRLSVMSNQEGYLYIIQQGSSGVWRPLYPPPGSTEPKKLVPGQEYDIPGGPRESFEFNGTPGKEKLFMLLSRTPEVNLDETIASLQQKPKAPSSSAPNNNVLAVNSIDSSLMAKLQSELRGRDLVFTKFDENQQQSGNDAAHADKATYVVNKASLQTPDAHIVVDVVLSHQ